MPLLMEHLLKRELKPHLILTVGIYQIVFISGKQLFSPVNRNPAPLAPQPGQESLSPDSEWPPWETHSPPQATQPEFLAFFFFFNSFTTCLYIPEQCCFILVLSFKK